MAQVSDLFALSKQINEATDEANQTLRDFESQMLKLNLGISAEVIIKRTEIPFSIAKNVYKDYMRTTDPCYELMSLAWAKVDGRWGLKLLSEIFQGPSNLSKPDEVIFSETQAVSNLSRQNRIIAISNLEKLVRAIKEAGEKLVRDVQEAKKFTATLL
jgi:hypothetical protein